MNIVLLIAGGVGSRFGANIPKQFVEINNKPIIAYTLETFQKAIEIDQIIVVSVAGWEDYIERLKDTFSITKLTHIITGGSSRFESIYKGLTSLEDIADKSDLILIHDAVRPCVTTNQINSSLRVAKVQGAALAVASCYDTMFVSRNGTIIDDVFPREELFKGQTPESIQYGIAYNAYKEAEQKGLYIDSPTSLLLKLNIPVGLSLGSQENLKITTMEDIALFKTIIEDGGNE
ncbi:IspD/TarI family cytidylyltransferase [Veillonella caviae]|uniref:IspD/TarI family cytidylyltransferase n=1 Tax=Veillonella caviae TaxID=248316 RepID=UPI0023F3FF7D|nr:IspD/TarI family cytidylyltransferase [Veillonella caviae]MCI6406538.1 2-C-methyl-D-erythritol 4-phosphate cytidylyltransferase [Veillonella caviae]MDY5787846.1 IspD/TarI family cytidylyltransferase [Veillonella caviae]MDY6225908.1 IspD/TarI family cytidylyltransferase [Veillonella caviae]